MNTLSVTKLPTLDVPACRKEFERIFSLAYSKGQIAGGQADSTLFLDDPEFIASTAEILLQAEDHMIVLNHFSNHIVRFTSERGVSEGVMREALDAFKTRVLSAIIEKCRMLQALTQVLESRQATAKNGRAHEKTVVGEKIAAVAEGAGIVLQQSQHPEAAA